MSGLAALKLIADEAVGKISPRGWGGSAGGGADFSRYTIVARFHEVELVNSKRYRHRGLDRGHSPQHR